MADTKITALAAITTVDPAADVLPIVDVSDTSMAASGTTKKITSNQILGAGGTATLASATITGDLTVDTSTLKVDSANNRVGIGTATPVNTLEVVAPAGDNIVSTFRSGDATAANNAGGGFRSISSATAASRVAQVWLDADGANLSGGDYFFIQKNGGSGTVEFNQFSNAAMTFLTNSTERLRIDSSGNLGLGVTPSAWKSNYRALQFTQGFAAIAGDNGNGVCEITSNAYFDSTNSRWQYYGAYKSARYQLDCVNGSHEWYTDNVGGAANGAITFTQAMTLDASGRLLVGPTSANASGGVLQLSSGITFPATQVASSDANTLDDYEEGTFTATLKGGTADPTTPVTTTGKYTKIGNQVFVEIQFGNVSTAGASGAITIIGLPFVGSSSGAGQIGCLLVDSAATFTNSSLSAYLPSGSATLSLYTSTSNSAITAITHNAGTGRYVWASITYHV